VATREQKPRETATVQVVAKKSLEQKKQGQGTGNFYSVITGADRIQYSSWDEDVRSSIEEGFTYEFTYYQTIKGNDVYNNIVSVKPVGDGPVQAPPSVGATGLAPLVESSRSTEKIAALNAAVEFSVAQVGFGHPIGTREVVILAQVFDQWLEAGQIPEKPVNGNADRSDSPGVENC